MAGATAIVASLLVPLAGAVAIGLAGRWPNLRETATLVTAVALAAAVWSLAPAVLAGERPELALFELVPGLALGFRVEPLGMVFAGLASTLWVVTSVYSIGYMRAAGEADQTRFYVCFAVALMAAMGVAFAADLVTLFLFYEVLTLSTYPLVAHKGDPATVRAARVYVGLLLATSIGLFLPAIVWTWTAAGTVVFAEGGVLAGRIAGPALTGLAALYLFGIGKAAVMPVHRWLPAAMVAPTPVSALLHAVAVVKAGVFTFAKVVVYIVGLDTLAAAPTSRFIAHTAAFTVVVAGLVALRQSDLKRLLAYSTVGQLSYVVLAAGLARPFTEIGAALHLVAHGLGKITLFFAAGAIYIAAGKTRVAELAGIGRRMPWTMAAFTVGALSMIGLPPTAGFASKWLILTGAAAAGDHTSLAALAASSLLAAAYLLPILYAAWFLDPPAGPSHGEAPRTMVAALTVTAALTVAAFLFSGPIVALVGQIARPHG